MRYRLCVSMTLVALAACSKAPADDPAPWIEPSNPLLAGSVQCFEATESAGGPHYNLRLRAGGYTLVRESAAAGRLGEQYGTWQPSMDTVAFGDQFADVGQMPKISRAWRRDAAGRLQGTLDAPPLVFSPVDCAPPVASAYETPMATLQVPAGTEVTFREDTRDFGRGEPGMYVSIDGPANTFVLVFSVIYAPAGAAPMDLRGEAADATPFGDGVSFTTDRIEIDGVPAARYEKEGQVMGVNLRSVAWAMEHNGCQVSITLNATGDIAPAMFESMVAATEAMRWKKDYRCVRPAAS
ncbi:hypothetical protein LF41_304 [Lysobacter dokdonensis DS-58]|uniref:Lipoprotein n=1 Tax=Lysobacter dokdonensis DS-58 TaxID=1300345 RepID=A0A0A2WEZ4_9GAMM|nr:hypothetical protein [Lysobacter dokdonensis]KGQ18771.1 hypothetical protein LF41_304 [Lysobacter dokdonensis DS-58]